MASGTASDPNKKSWEDADIPAICESCLGPSPYIEMLRQRHGAECKLCTRPFTVFKWVPNKGGKYSKTVICMTCSRQKNCCQSCLNDLTYGLPISIRDAALKMASGSGNISSLGALVAADTSNAITKQYIAQNYEKAIQNGSIEAPENSSVSSEQAARELLTSLSQAMKKSRQEHIAGIREHRRQNHGETGETSANVSGSTGDDAQEKSALMHNVSRLVSKLPLKGSLKPVPQDESITSFYIAGIEEDLPEYKIREYFEPHMTDKNMIKSLFCVHRAKSGFVTFKNRREAEMVAQSIMKSTKNGDGRIVIDARKLKLAWGKPRDLGKTYAEQTQIGRFVGKALRGKVKAKGEK